MIDPQNPTIQALAMQGYEISAHAYFKSGQLRFTYFAKHPNGAILQGWSRGGGPEAALADLAKGWIETPYFVHQIVLGAR